MIPHFVQAWYANKEKLEQHISTHNQYDFADDYKMMVRTLFELVINPYLKTTNWLEPVTENIHEIKDGMYTGTALYLLPCGDYDPQQYVATYIDYGSCSGCDTLLGIQSESDGDVPTAEQVKKYMTLFLHLLQHCKYVIDDEDEDGA